MRKSNGCADCVHNVEWLEQGKQAECDEHETFYGEVDAPFICPKYFPVEEIYQLETCSYCC